MNQQRFGRVADTRALDLGVQDDVDRHFDVATGIDIDVAVSLVVFQDGHGRLGDDPADQAFAAARNGQVDQVGKAEKLADRRPVDRRDELNGGSRQPAAGELIGQHPMEGTVGERASLPPRKMTALPLLTQRAAASTVTLGRLSKITAIISGLSGAVIAAASRMSSRSPGVMSNMPRLKKLHSHSARPSHQEHNVIHQLVQEWAAN